MSQKLPRVDPDDVIKVLKRLGFSHPIYKKNERRVTVPYHAGKTLHPKVLGSIIEDSGVSEREFLDLLR